MLGECGGDCLADVDHDGICDDEDDCIGAPGRVRVCNGPGPVFECGCSDIQEGECDCFGSEEDAIGVCGGGCDFDMDFDGICDDEDPCIGTFDACGSATALAPFTLADAPLSLWATAIATETKPTPWVSVAAIAQKTSMPTHVRRRGQLCGCADPCGVQRSGRGVRMRL